MTTLPLVPFLAHAGEGASWQALLTVISVGVTVVLLLTLAGRVELESMGDLVLPLSAVAVLASLAPVAGDPISDAAIYAVPVGAVFLVVLLIIANRGRSPGWTDPLVIGGAVAAVALTAAVAPTLEDAWYPPEAQGATAELTATSAGEASLALRAGVVEEGLQAVVTLADASVGPDDPRPVGDDPTEGGRLRLTVDGERVVVEPAETCTIARPCTTLTYTLRDLEPGPHRIEAELLRSDGSSFEPPLTDALDLTTG